MIHYNGREWHPQEFAICIGMDAFRIALGMQPKNFSFEEVACWLAAMSEVGR